jgi:hypothetical protein
MFLTVLNTAYESLGNTLKSYPNHRPGHVTSQSTCVSFKDDRFGATGVAQVVAHLPSKLKALSSIPNMAKNERKKEKRRIR